MIFKNRILYEVLFFNVLFLFKVIMNWLNLLMFLIEKIVLKYGIIFLFYELGVLFN